MSTYATQMDAAKQGILTPEMETVAKEEHLEPELVRERVAKGTICIPANIYHKSIPTASAKDCAPRSMSILESPVTAETTPLNSKR